MVPEVLLTERMLGHLARWLRLLGLDAPLLERPPALVPPGALLLTRRRRLEGRPGVILVRSDRLSEQLAQVLAEFARRGLRPQPALFFTRCLDCNLAVEPLGREQAAGLVADHTLHTAASFTRCPGCGKVYWSGSHGQRALALFEEFRAKGGA